jgi:hypothetical protein
MKKLPALFSSVRLPRFAFPALALATLIPSAAHAATLYWDTNGATAGAGTTANGTWDVATTSNWSTDSTGNSATTTYTSGDNVVFSAGSDVSTASISVASTLEKVVGSLTFEEGNYAISGSKGVGFSGSINVASGVTVTSTTTFNAQGSSAMILDISGTLSATSLNGGKFYTKIGSGTATFANADAGLTINGGTIEVGGGGEKVKAATINNTGKLKLIGSNAIINSVSVAVNAGGTLELAAGVTDTVNAVSGAGLITGASGSALTTGGNNGSSTFDGTIEGAIGLNLTGTGTFSFTGTSTSTGNTSISVDSTFTQVDGAAMTFTIGANGLNNAILGTGIANLSGTFSFNLDGADLTNGNSWLIVDVDNLNETFAGTFLVSGFTESANVWTNGAGLSFSEATGILSYSAIPEPSSFALFGGLASLALISLRRRRA